MSPGERGYVYAVPVDPPDLGSLSPYLYKALARDGGNSTSGPVLGEADTIPFPVDARVIEVGKSYEEAGDTVSTFAALLAAAIFISFWSPPGAPTCSPARRYRQ